MKKILNQYLTQEEIECCQKVAEFRRDQQIKDAKSKNRDLAERSSYSNGSPGRINSRSLETRLADAFIGAISECIAAKLTKTIWTKEHRQYYKNKNPDLFALYNGQKIQCEVRGTRSQNVICRLKRDIYKFKTSLLIAITNVPSNINELINKNYISEIGYIDFGSLCSLCKEHPEWEIYKYTDSPIHLVPMIYFKYNFEEVFG